VTPGIASRPQAIFNRRRKAILAAAHKAFLTCSDDLSVQGDVPDEKVEQVYVAVRIAYLVLEMGELSQVIEFAADQGEIQVRDELGLQLAASGERVVHLAALYGELKKGAVNA